MTDEFGAPEGACIASTPQPDPKRGGRSCTILVVRDLLLRATGAGLDDVRDNVICDLIARDEVGFCSVCSRAIERIIDLYSE